MRFITDILYADSSRTGAATGDLAPTRLTCAPRGPFTHRETTES